LAPVGLLAIDGTGHSDVPRFASYLEMFAEDLVRAAGA